MTQENSEGKGRGPSGEAQATILSMDEYRRKLEERKAYPIILENIKHLLPPTHTPEKGPET